MVSLYLIWLWIDVGQKAMSDVEAHLKACASSLFLAAIDDAIRTAHPLPPAFNDFQICGDEA